MGVEPFLIVSTVKTVIAQRLVRVLSAGKEKYFMTEAEKKALKEPVKRSKRVVQFEDEEQVQPVAKRSKGK